MWLPFTVAVLLSVFFSAVLKADDEDRPFLPGPTRVVSTVPANGDGNPYGVAFVPFGFPAGGTIKPGDVLVSNFNNAPTSTGGNLQGTGTTIVDVPPNAPVSQFFQSATPTGLTTALNVLRRGFVLVGNFPSADGLCTDAGRGSIFVIDKGGNLVSEYTGSSVQGPWDSALFDNDASNISFDPNQPSELVEFTIGGEFVKEISLESTPGGSFGLAVEKLGKTAKLAAVDDSVNLLIIWTLKSGE